MTEDQIEYLERSQRFEDMQAKRRQMQQTETPSRAKWLLGGGALAAFAWWLFGKGGSGKGDKDGSGFPADGSRLVFFVRDGGLTLKGSPNTLTVDGAVARVIQGHRKDVSLIIPGDTKQRNVETALSKFAAAGIEVYQ